MAATVTYLKVVFDFGHINNTVEKTESEREKKGKQALNAFLFHLTNIYPTHTHTYPFHIWKVSNIMWTIGSDAVLCSMSFVLSHPLNALSRIPIEHTNWCCWCWFSLFKHFTFQSQTNFQPILPSGCRIRRTRKSLLKTIFIHRFYLHSWWVVISDLFCCRQCDVQLAWNMV